MKNLLAVLAKPIVWGLLAALGVGLGIGIALAWLNADDYSGMVWIEGGSFVMGASDPQFRDAHPARTVQVNGFWMDATEVTNAQWRRFATATGYKTIAERKPTQEQFPSVPADKLVPFSLVFRPPAALSDRECADCMASNRVEAWWVPLPGADWQHPDGPHTNIDGRDAFPVVHIAYDDAVAYCRWSNKRLPTEAEWEYAARGGLARKPFYWGDVKHPDGKWMANTFQGNFPKQDTGDDGHAGLAPVKQYPPNAFGLHDMSGNVWEWCADWYRADYYSLGETLDPKGPERSIDPCGNGEPKRVQRGGSYLCADAYCVRYRAGSRGHGAPDTGQSHTGFRCVRTR